MQLRMAVRVIRLDPDGGDVLDSLETLDISRGGIGAVTQRPLYPGQRVLLRLPLSSNGGRRSIYATVVRCRRTEDGYKVGMEFDSVSIGAVSRPAAVAAAA